MTILGLLVLLVLLGVGLWAINTKVPMDGTIRVIINVVVILVVILLVLYAFGLMNWNVRVPQVNEVPRR